MTQTGPSAKALEYAEQTLGVHKTYDEAVTARNYFEGVNKELLQVRARRRQLEGYLRDREMEVAEEVHRTHASESQAARDRLLKVAINNDGDIRETRDELTTLAGQADFLEVELERHSQDIKIAVARMQELGGYFQYLAAVKQAQQSQQSQPSQTGSPWT